MGWVLLYNEGFTMMTHSIQKKNIFFYINNNDHILPHKDQLFFFLSIELVMLSLTMVPWVFLYLPTFFALLDVVHKKGELFVYLCIYWFIYFTK